MVGTLNNVFQIVLVTPHLLNSRAKHSNVIILLMISKLYWNKIIYYSGVM